MNKFWIGVNRLMDAAIDLLASLRRPQQRRPTMNKFMIPRTALALRSMLNNLHLSSVTSYRPKACSLLLIIVFGLTQLPMPSAAKARPKARLIFDTSYVSSKSSDTSFGAPSGIGTTTGKSIRKLPEGDAVYSWRFPETISPAGATFIIGVAAKANGSGGALGATISWLGSFVKDEGKPSSVDVYAKPGEGLQTAKETYTIVPQEAYDSPQVLFSIRCNGGFDVVLRYTVEQ